MIYDMYLDGCSLRKIADELFAEVSSLHPVRIVGWRSTLIRCYPAKTILTSSRLTSFMKRAFKRIGGLKGVLINLSYHFVENMV